MHVIILHSSDKILYVLSKSTVLNFNSCRESIYVKHFQVNLSALIKSCDLVITISNVIAHLSGAIGKKTWVIVPLNTQWHWFHDRNNSLWYLNVKLFRQTQYGKWENIIEKIYNEILNLQY